MHGYGKKLGYNSRNEKPSLSQLRLLKGLGMVPPPKTTKYEAAFYIDTLLKQRRAKAKLSRNE